MRIPGHGVVETSVLVAEPGGERREGPVSGYGREREWAANRCCRVQRFVRGNSFRTLASRSNGRSVSLPRASGRTDHAGAHCRSGRQGGADTDNLITPASPMGKRSSAELQSARSRIVPSASEPPRWWGARIVTKAPAAPSGGPCREAQATCRGACPMTLGWRRSWPKRGSLPSGSDVRLTGADERRSPVSGTRIVRASWGGREQGCAWGFR
jgi:hypothetical protein